MHLTLEISIFLQEALAQLERAQQQLEDLKRMSELQQQTREHSERKLRKLKAKNEKLQSQVQAEESRLHLLQTESAGIDLEIQHQVALTASLKGMLYMKLWRDNFNTIQKKRHC
jgi:chromosome segregation ATPase